MPTPMRSTLCPALDFDDVVSRQARHEKRRRAEVPLRGRREAAAVVAEVRGVEVIAEEDLRRGRIPRTRRIGSRLLPDDAADVSHHENDAVPGGIHASENALRADSVVGPYRCVWEGA